MWLLLLLVGIPAMEIYLFIEIGGAIGAGWTFILIIATALWGLSAMRAQGLAVLAEAQRAQAAGRPPVAAAAHGVLILMAGLMLLIPGFFTDALGFLLLLRPLRALLLETLLAALLPQIMRGFAMRQGRGPHAADTPDSSRGPRDQDLPPGVIDGDFRVEDEEK